MKVLEAGKHGNGEKWTMQCRCTAWGNSTNGCDALLEVEFTDLRYFPGSGGEMTWGYRDPAVSFKCPCCGKLTDLEKKDWPVGYAHLTSWTSSWQNEPPGFEQ